METAFACEGFEWDEHNVRKNWEKHGVSFAESEEIFFNEPLLVAEVDRSKILYGEQRRLAYGVSNEKRPLFIVFTMRNNKIRIISARDMNRKEKKFYHEEAKNSN
ncbi:MAG: BrnT family toxin [Elusimicrobia bacterium]|nr:BrnT family toxin [Elusimicrobiota bacterium]